MKEYQIPKNKSATIRVVIELIALLILVYPMLHIYVFLQGELEPHKRGFFCDDDTIKHPVVQEEISVGEAFIVWACIVIFIVPSIELLHVTVFEHGTNQQFCRIPWVVVELYRILGYFTMGGFFTLLTTEMAKYKIGRHRPYFLTLCNISYTKDLCEDQYGYSKFVEDFSCNGDAHEVREASKSFLSGHASFSFYCATFLIVYLHARLSNLTGEDAVPSKYPKTKNIFRGLKILRPFFQFGIFSLAFYICLTRITDYKHHPGDVLVGMIVGIFFAIMVLMVLMDLFRKPRIFKMIEFKKELDFGEVDGVPLNATEMRSTTNSDSNPPSPMHNNTQ